MWYVCKVVQCAKQIHIASNYICTYVPVYKLKLKKAEIVIEEAEVIEETEVTEEAEVIEEVEVNRQKMEAPDFAPRSLNDWEKAWTSNKAGWHEEDGNQTLKNNISKLMSKYFPTKNPGDMTVFVPLCGKTKDMYMFYQMGMTVIGVEFAPQPIKEFFEENKVTYAKTDKTPYTKSLDERLILGEGDLFSFKVGEKVEPTEHKLPFSKFDIIWDRGSFEALGPTEKDKYVKYMSELLAQDGLYLLSTVDYDEREYTGPPFNTNEEGVRLYYGTQFSVEKIETEDMLKSKTKDHWIAQGLTWMTSSTYVMRNKQ